MYNGATDVGAHKGTAKTMSVVRIEPRLCVQLRMILFIMICARLTIKLPTNVKATTSKGM